MANSPSPTVEELQLRKRARRRLIGAVTLVALMVTILPMVLDDEPKPVGQDIAINIPSQQGTDILVKPGKPPQPPEQAVPPAPAPQAVPAQPEKHVAPTDAAPAPKPAETRQETTPLKKQEKSTEKPKETKPAVIKAAEPQHTGNGYVVMLGAFSSEANAKQRQAKLKEMGIKYYVEKVKSPAGEKTGIRAGPYPNRQEAEHVLAKLKMAGIQDALVAEKK